MEGDILELVLGDSDYSDIAFACDDKSVPANAATGIA